MIGRLLRDPEKQLTGTGKVYAELMIGVEKRVRPMKPGADAYDSFHAVCWNQTAMFVLDYACIGRLVSIDGRLEVHRYLDGEGNKREKVSIVCDNVSVLDRAKEQETALVPEPMPGHDPRAAGRVGRITA